MEAAMHIGTVQSKKHLKHMTQALCEIMMCAQDAERSDETTQVAINALLKVAEVRDVHVSDCTFYGADTAMHMDPNEE